jgi:hypothetical protein
VAHSRPADLFTMTSPPRLDLPVAHMETAIAVAPGASGTWRLAALDMHLPRGVAARVAIGADGTAQILDSASRPLVSLTGCRWSEGGATS